MKRHNFVNILSALIVSVLALTQSAPAAAVTASPCIVCGEDCNGAAIEWCYIHNCYTAQQATCPAPNADCTWDWDDNDEGIICYGAE